MSALIDSWEFWPLLFLVCFPGLVIGTSILFDLETSSLAWWGALAATLLPSLALLILGAWIMGVFADGQGDVGSKSYEEEPWS